MYNFKMNKERSEDIIKNCNLDSFEKKIFKELISATKRKDIYKKFDISYSTMNRAIRRLEKRIAEYENNKPGFTYKLYIHTFPNNKIYIGVCQCCEDRWSNGHGYAYNVEMYKDIKKYGWENIEHTIILEHSSGELVYQLERNLIKTLKTYENNIGYNKRY